MNIAPINSNNDISMRGKAGGWKNFKKRVCQKILDTLPDATYNDSKEIIDKLKKIDERISRPAENRAIMGVTAILTQPGIDSLNPNADEETRRMSMIKDVSKITVGTTVGILVRGTCFKIVEKMTDISSKNLHSKYLLPNNKEYLKEFTEKMASLKNYRNALSTGLAILVMCFTNFAIDMPLTLILTNKLNDKTKKYIAKGQNSENKEIKKDFQLKDGLTTYSYNTNNNVVPNKAYDREVSYENIA